MELYKGWNAWNLDTMVYITRKRLQALSSEIGILNSSNCKLDLEQKLQKVMQDSADELIQECITSLNAQEEFECRVLSGIKNILINEKPDELNKYYFLYELLESLLRYEKTEEDYQKIKNAIYHPLNKAQIGLTLYKKISDRKHLF